MAELPNWKIKRKTRTPVEFRNVLSRDASTYLNSCLNSVKCGNRDKVKTSKRPQSAVGEFSFRRKRVKCREKVRKFEDGENIELIVMRQFRKGLMLEIGKQGEITAERLEVIRRRSVQKEFLDMEDYREKQQLKKMKRELLSRSPLDNAIYLLRAMPKRGRNLVIKELNTSIPHGTRFLNSRPSTSV